MLVPGYRDSCHASISGSVFSAGDGGEPKPAEREDGLVTKRGLLLRLLLFLSLATDTGRGLTVLLELELPRRPGAFRAGWKGREAWFCSGNNQRSLSHDIAVYIHIN